MHAEIRMADASRRVSFARLASMREAGLIAIILALCIAMSFASPHFLKYKTATEKMVRSLRLVDTTPILLCAKATGKADGSATCM